LYVRWVFCWLLLFYHAAGILLVLGLLFIHCRAILIGRPLHIRLDLLIVLFGLLFAWLWSTKETKAAGLLLLNRASVVCDILSFLRLLLFGLGLVWAVDHELVSLVAYELLSIEAILWIRAAFVLVTFIVESLHFPVRMEDQSLLT
jgi:hypothetical protein